MAEWHHQRMAHIMWHVCGRFHVVWVHQQLEIAKSKHKYMRSWKLATRYARLECAATADAFARPFHFLSARVAREPAECWPACVEHWPARWHLSALACCLSRFAPRYGPLTPPGVATHQLAAWHYRHHAREAQDHRQKPRSPCAHAACCARGLHVQRPACLPAVV